MPTRFTLPLPSGGNVLVKQGDQVDKDTCLAQVAHRERKEKINIASLLGVPASNFAKFLTCSIGGKISKGAVIARRTKFFTEIIVSAPFEAKLTSVDLSKGTIELSKIQPEEFELRSPIAGRIIGIKDDEIELSFKGEIIEVDSGYGKAVGKLVSVIDRDKPLYSIDHQIAGKIVLMKPSDTLLAKLQALEAAGVVTSSSEVDIKLPFVIIDGDRIGQLANFVGKEVIIDGDHCFVAVVE